MLSLTQERMVRLWEKRDFVIHSFVSLLLLRSTDLNSLYNSLLHQNGIFVTVFITVTVIENSD